MGVITGRIIKQILHGGLQQRTGNRPTVALAKLEKDQLRSRNNAVLFETKIVHRLVYDFFNLLPI